MLLLHVRHCVNSDFSVGTTRWTSLTATVCCADTLTGFAAAVSRTQHSTLRSRSLAAMESVSDCRTSTAATNFSCSNPWSASPEQAPITSPFARAIRVTRSLRNCALSQTTRIRASFNGTARHQELRWHVKVLWMSWVSLQLVGRFCELSVL